MRILLTNDDGYDAPGLAALVGAVRRLGESELTIIAPAEAYSGKGHVVSPAVRFRRETVADLGEVVVVEGTPGDCVRAGISLPDHPRPDWVISGINRGSNLGVDVYYSGTVAASREAAILGIPSVAVSQLVRADVPVDWSRSSRQAAVVLAAVILSQEPDLTRLNRVLYHQARQALRQGPPVPAGAAGVYWNINLPAVPAEQPPAGVRLVPLSTDPLSIRYENRCDPDGIECLHYTGNYHERPAAPGTDVAAVFAGAIAISRLRL